MLARGDDEDASLPVGTWAVGSGERGGERPSIALKEGREGRTIESFMSYYYSCVGFYVDDTAYRVL